MQDVKICFEAVRVNAHKTQKEWAEMIGVSVGTVVNWEKGLTEPTMTQVREMSRLSGIPTDLIFCTN